MSGLHEVQTGSGRLAGKVAIVTGTYLFQHPQTNYTSLSPASISLSLSLCLSSPPPFHFTQKPQVPQLTIFFVLVWLSTGAASGFGLACTKKFVEEGAKVVAADMNGDGLQKVYPANSQYDQHVQTVTANVTVQADWDKMVKTAVEKFGGLDVLVNNAGTSYKNKPTLEVTEQEYDRVMAVNVKSIFLSVAAAVPALKGRGGGAIINVASIGAMRPRPGLVWYNASKAAVANVSFSP